MNLFNRIKNKIGILTLATIFGLSGCMVKGPIKTVFTGPELVSVSEKEQFINFTNKKLIISNCNIKQELNKGVVKIEGYVKCSYDRKKYEFYDQTWVGMMGKDVRRITSPIITTHEEMIPSGLEILINYKDKSFTQDIKISKEGSFKTDIIDSRLKQPKNKEYYELRYYNMPVKIDVSSEDEKKLANIGKPPWSWGPNYFEEVEIGKVKGDYYYKPNQKKIREFVDENINSKIFLVSIQTKDQITRVPTKYSRIEIKCLDSPDIPYQLEQEFQDRELIEQAQNYIKGYLTKGEKQSGVGGSIYSNIIKGAKYQVETFDPNYYYFTAVFTATPSSKEKEILLIETGSKVRIDNTKEGQGMLINK